MSADGFSKQSRPESCGTTPRWPRWLILALLTGPISAALVYLAYWEAGVPLDADFPLYLASKGLHEVAALVIAAVPVLMLVPLALLTRDFLISLLVGFALVVLMREHHMEGTAFTGAVRLAAYVLAGALMAVAVVFRHRVVASPYWPTLRPWLIAAAVAYAWAVVGQRAMFKRALPYGRAMHVPLEEVGENAAHLLVVFTSAAAWRCRAVLTCAVSRSATSVCPSVESSR